jgi:hypothetical protein
MADTRALGTRNYWQQNADRSNSKDLKAIFAPLITDILRLIDDQVKSVKIKRQNQGVTVRHCCAFVSDSKVAK